LFRYEQLVGSWSSLASTLDERGVLSGWQHREPVLAEVESVSQLREATGKDRPNADALVDALVRLAAVAGDADQDAAMVIVHLLTPGAVRLTNRLASSLGRGHRDLAAQIPELVIGELVVQIRSYRLDRRTERCAAKLLWRTLEAVDRELAMMTRRELPAEPWVIEAQLAGKPSFIDSGADPDVQDLLAWAHHEGVITASDAVLIRHFLHTRNDGAGGLLRTATALGICERTARRRRDAAIAALRSARTAYLRDAA
jgi:hypothetical protein